MTVYLAHVGEVLVDDLGDGPLFVAALDTLPKLRGSPPGTTTWLRDRLRPA